MTTTESGAVDVTAHLKQLLEAAAAAHGIHEETELGGVYDTEWPAWYAAHMAKALDEAGYDLVARTR